MSEVSGIERVCAHSPKVEDKAETVSVHPTEEKQIVEALSSFFALNLSAFSPQTVFETCTKGGRFELLKKFAQCESREQKMDFMIENSEMLQISRELKAVLQEEEKKKKIDANNETLTDKRELLLIFLAEKIDGRAPYFGVENGEVHKDQMVELLLFWDKKYPYDILEKLKNPKEYAKLVSYFGKKYEKSESTKEKSIEPKSPELRISELTKQLESSNYLGLADDGQLSAEEKSFLIQTIFLKEKNEKIDFMEGESKEIRSFLEEKLNRFREEAFKKDILANPDARKEAIRTHLEAHNYWGLKDKLGEGMEHLDFLIDQVYLKERIEGSVLKRINDGNEKLVRNFFHYQLIVKKERSHMKIEKKEEFSHKKKEEIKQGKKEKQDKYRQKKEEEKQIEQKISGELEEEGMVKKEHDRMKEIINNENYKGNARAIINQLLFESKGGKDKEGNFREPWTKESRQDIENYAKLLDVGERSENPQDQKVLNQIVYANLTSYGGDIGASFLASLDNAMNSDQLSEEMKENIAQKFNLNREPNLTTGSDVKEALSVGYGIDENGEKIPYTKENPLKITEGVTVCEQRVRGVNRFQIDVSLGDWRNIKVNVPPGTDGDKLGEYIYTAQMMFSLEKLGGMGRFVFGRDINNFFESGDLDVYETDVDLAARVGESFLGGFSGHDGEIMKQPHINQLKHSLQWFHKKGDWATDDVDKRAVQEGLTELGILEDGKLNEEKFFTAAEFIQLEYMNGAPNFEDLKDVLMVGESLKDEEKENEESASLSTDDLMALELAALEYNA